MSYFNTITQRPIQQEVNNYSQRAFSSKPYSEQYQPLPNVAKMTINQMPSLYQQSNQGITNYHFSQIEKARALFPKANAPQYSNINPITNQPFPSTNKPYPPSTNQPYPPSTNQPYPPSTNQVFPPSTNQPYPPSKIQPYPPSTNQPYPPSKNQPYPPSTNQPFPSSTNQPFPSSTNQAKDNYYDTLNRNFLNSQYASKEPLPSYATDKKENNNPYSNRNINMLTMMPGNSQINPVNFNKNNNSQFSVLPKQAITELQRNDYMKSYINSTNTNNTPINLKTNVVKPSYKIEKWSVNSKAGKNANGLTKTNQDSYIMKETNSNGIHMKMAGVFDGHGIEGHHVSGAIKTFFTSVDLTNNNDPILNSISQQYKPTEQQSLFNDKTYSILKQAFNSLSLSINSNKSFDSIQSGSTCVVVLISDNKIICANCGDSRAIMIQDNGNVVPLSRDHKPELPDERERIIRNGGRVEKVPYFYGEGPFRVWLKYENYPGLAMSRSIGDQVAKSVGVTADPEIFEFDLQESKPKMIIVASDGVWEFLSNEQVTHIVMPYYSSGDCDGAAKRLAEVSLEMWNKEQSVVDDITAVVIFFSNQ